MLVRKNVIQLLEVLTVAGSYCYLIALLYIASFCIHPQQPRTIASDMPHQHVSWKS